MKLWWLKEVTRWLVTNQGFGEGDDGDGINILNFK